MRLMIFAAMLAMMLPLAAQADEPPEDFGAAVNDRFAAVDAYHSGLSVWFGNRPVSD